MLTKNGKLAMQTTFYRGTAVFKDFTNTDSTVSSNNWSIFTSSDNKRFYVGYGTTAPTSSDYSMEDLDTDLTQISIIKTPNASISYSDDFVCSYTATYKNNTENNIVITEIGFGFYNTYGGYSSDDRNVLLAREVLETPVTIEPNKSYSFSITIS